MQFTEFSIPESTKWMEKSDILFLVDCCSHETPFISKSIINGYDETFEDPYDIILDRIHPDDIEEFRKVIEGRSSRPAHHKLRIIDNENHIQLFSFHRLRVTGLKKELLLAISKKRYHDPVIVKLPVSW